MVQNLSRFFSFALGVTSATGFAPLGLWPVTLLCLALLMRLILQAADLRGALVHGYWFGVGHFALGLNWIAGSFRYQDAMPVWLGWIAVVVVALYLAVYPAMAAGLAWRYGRQRHESFILVFATAWIVTEWLRAKMFTGFAWNPLGAALVDFGSPAIWIGSYGLSGLVILLAGLVLLIIRRKWEAAFWVATALALPWAAAFWMQNSAATSAGSGTGKLLHIVQPNIGQDIRNREDADALRLERLERHSGFAGTGPRLILWPEAAAPGFIESETWARERIALSLGAKDMMLTGADALVYNREGKLTGAHNSVFLVTPDARLLSRYDKAHLVPYGEYLALRWLLEPLGATRLVPGDIDFLPGPGPRTLDVPGFGKAGIQICYEIIFSGEVVDRNNRPDFIFNPSNDAWFGAWGSPQFLAQARLRAIEEGLPVVRSTPTGISAIINAQGQVVRAIDTGRAGSITADLPPRHVTTFFARYGNIIPLIFAMFLTVIGVALRRRAL